MERKHSWALTPCCVSLEKFGNLPEPQFPHLKIWSHSPFHKAIVDINEKANIT